MAIKYQSPALSELTEAIQWYEKQMPGLGKRFLQSTLKTEKQIAMFPEMHQKIYKNIRRAIVPVFPYTMLYYIKGTNIFIISIFNCRQNPSAWMSRVL